MTISGLLTTQGKAALLKHMAGVKVGGVALQDVVSYFVVGEGNHINAGTSGELVAHGDNSTTSYTYTCAKIGSSQAIARGSVTISLAGLNITDDGNGSLMHSFHSTLLTAGTVNYKTGVISFTTIDPTGDGNDITVTYNYWNEPDAPANNTNLASATRAQNSPSDPTDPDHLAWYKKSFGADANTTVTYSDTPTPNLTVQMYLDLPEFIDDGRGETPLLFEVGVFNSNDVMIAYCTFTGNKKTGATIWTRTMTINI